MLAGEAAIRLHLSVERGQVTAAVTPAASAAVPSPERRRRPGAISHASSLSPTTERELALSQLQRRREKEARKELLHQFRSGVRRDIRCTGRQSRPGDYPPLSMERELDSIFGVA